MLEMTPIKYDTVRYLAVKVGNGRTRCFAFAVHVSRQNKSWQRQNTMLVDTLQMLKLAPTEYDAAGSLPIIKLATTEHDIFRYLANVRVGKKTIGIYSVSRQR